MAISIETLVLAKNFAKSYTDAAIAAFPKGMIYKGAVDYYSDLPSNAEVGDVYTVKYEGTTGEVPLGVEYGWGTYEGTNQWIDLGPDLSRYQPLLVSGTNIKTINGNSILGSGDMIIATNQEFPSSWPVSSSTTTKAFCDVVNADSTAVEGMSYLGEVLWSDLPFNGNAEVVVQVMNGTGTSNKVIHLILTSGNVAPYRWEYTYWNNGSNVSGWIAYATAESAKDLFYCTYGTTTFAEITAAINAGKLPVCIYNDRAYSFASYSSSVYRFSSAQSDYIRYATVNDSNVWAVSAYNFELANNKVTSISSSSTDTQYPSAKCVYDFVQPNPTLAGTETALTGLKLNGTSYKVPTFDPTTISGYDATKTQFLSHVQGTLTWVDGTTFAALNNTQYGTPNATLFAVADGSILATSDTNEPVSPVTE